MFRKILIANRGEIALRVIRTLREMGIASVAVYSDADRAALHVRKADEAAHLGPAAASESYLNISRILDAARRHNADAIHPAYGFLSENATFARACEDSGIAFIGPSSKSIELMGSKTAARRVAKDGGAPIVPGTEDDPSAFARHAGFPVMLKAVAGGGGKGMRRVDREADLASSFDAASSEALRAFGDGRIYVEKLIENARHIEIQIFGDKHGNLVHLGERECSVQRRHQKVIEESPSPLTARIPGLRERMGEAAVRAARAAGYFNAGTVEFLADNSGNFYFLEMNTRLQVEHPVTELVTGLDLVRLQIEIAAGAELPFAQDDLAIRGAAIECRIYAEDPAAGFFPSPGKITQLAEPSGPGVRVDSGIYQGWTVPLDYDPMLSKLIVWAGTREHAVERMLRALSEYHIGGIRSNIPLFPAILNDAAFRAGDLHTGYLDDLLKSGIKLDAASDDPQLAAIAALVAARQKPRVPRPAPGPSAVARRRTRGAAAVKPDIVEVEPGVYSILTDGASYEVRAAGGAIFINGFRFEVETEDPRQWKRPGAGAGPQGRATIIAPMPGKIVRVLVEAGDDVEAGQGIVVVEAMKMQNELKSSRAGRVSSIAVKPADSVNAGTVLATIE